MQPLKVPLTPPGQLPPGYREALYWQISGTRARTIVIYLLSVPLFFAWFFVFAWLANTFGHIPDSISLSSLPELISILAAFLLVLVLHELTHGVFMRSFGAHPEYGVLWKALAFYTTSPGFAYQRTQHLIIALAPLVVLSVAAVVLMAFISGTAWVALITLAAALNASGAVGDLWIAALVLRYPRNAYVIDERDGVRIFLPGEGIADTPPSAQ
ncbi:MAG: DUF3267 domain-containing protein [Chloroflexi bacterium]|nr:DUF3267 domain-containing protein [Chloroflexota bacterium]